MWYQQDCVTCDTTDKALNLLMDLANKIERRYAIRLLPMGVFKEKSLC